jgi:hypothetical protein
MRRLFLTIIIVCVAILPTWAQEEAPPEPTPEVTYRVTLDSVLEIAWLRIENRFNPFGESQVVVRGELYNPNQSMGYSDISLFSFAYATEGDEEPIAEGFGFPVTICGFTPFAFTIPAQGRQYFDIPLELYGDESNFTHLEIAITANEAESPVAPAPIANITQISDDEVVSVEFPREAPLRYAIGCEKQPFTAWAWYGYNPETESFDFIEHPAISQVTLEARERMRLRDDAEFNHSFVSVAPISRRLIYQSGVNHFYTAQPDGGNRRYVHQDLSRFSLQGIIWATESDAFLAYYFGAYGEQIRYFTARATSEWISRSVYGGTVSYTVPGPNSQATEVIITTDELGPMGYYVKHTFLTSNRLLFEADPPGNNYPAPVWMQRGGIDQAYIARPIDGIPTLQCYNFRTDTLTTLTPLPLTLTENDRAWMWVSPDISVLMLSQNGIAGGLWQVDLTALPECE